MANSKGVGIALTETRVLVRQARDGDKTALAALIDRYRPRLCRWAAGRVPGDLRGLLETEDLVQGALLKTLTNVERLHRSGSFHSYLRSIVLNALRDEIRRCRTVVLDPEKPVADPAPSPAERLAGSTLLESYEKALSKLSERERAAIVGRLEWDLSYRELAAELDFPSPDAARMAVSRSLIRLSRWIRVG